MSVPLTTEQLEAFKRDGFVVVRGFYEAAEIEPIQRGIHAIIGLVMEEQGLTSSNRRLRRRILMAAFRN